MATINDPLAKFKVGEFGDYSQSQSATKDDGRIDPLAKFKDGYKKPEKPLIAQPEESNVNTLKDTFMSGMRNTQSALMADQLQAGLINPDEFATGLAENERLNAQKEQHPDKVKLIQDISDAEGFWETTGEVLKAPFTNPSGVARFTVEQAGNMLPTAVGAAGGAVAGSAVPVVGTGIGALAGMSLGTIATETGHELLSALQKTGVNTQDPEAIKAALTPEFMDKALERGLVRGSTIAAVDLATVGASKWLMGAPGRELADNLVKAGYDVSSKEAIQKALGSGSPAVVEAAEKYNKSKTLLGRAKTGAAPLALEVAGEPTGEALAQVAVGDEVDGTEVALEALGGLGASIATTGAVAATEGGKVAYDKAKGNKEPAIKNPEQPAYDWKADTRPRDELTPEQQAARTQGLIDEARQEQARIDEVQRKESEKNKRRQQSPRAQQLQEADQANQVDPEYDWKADKRPRSELTPEQQEARSEGMIEEARKEQARIDDIQKKESEKNQRRKQPSRAEQLQNADTTPEAVDTPESGATIEETDNKPLSAVDRQKAKRKAKQEEANEQQAQTQTAEENAGEAAGAEAESVTPETAPESQAPTSDQEDESVDTATVEAKSYDLLKDAEADYADVNQAMNTIVRDKATNKFKIIPGNEFDADRHIDPIRDHNYQMQANPFNYAPPKDYKGSTLDSDNGDSNVIDFEENQDFEPVQSDQPGDVSSSEIDNTIKSLKGQEFTPTHEMPNGDLVQAVDGEENIYVDAEGTEWEEENARPIAANTDNADPVAENDGRVSEQPAAPDPGQSDSGGAETETAALDDIPSDTKLTAKVKGNIRKRVQESLDAIAMDGDLNRKPYEDYIDRAIDTISRKDPEFANELRTLAGREADQSGIPEDSPAVKGRTAKVYTPEGRELDTEYTAIDQSGLITSNDEAGAINPNFPQNLQPRDRSGKKSQLQIKNLADNIQPERLAESSTLQDGAPIVGTDNVVESGNGRVLGIRKAYKDGKGKQYKQWLQDNADKFGLDAEQIASMDQPVLVRKRTTELSDDERVKLTVDANKSNVAAMPALELAKTDAKAINEELLSIYQPDESGNVLAASNNAFLQQFAKNMGASDAAGLTSADGRWTKQMADRVQAAVFQFAYGNGKLTGMLAQDADPDIKNIIKALNSAARSFAMNNARGAKESGHDLSGVLGDAAEVILSAKEKGRSVPDMVAQAGMFGDIPADVAAIAQLFDRNKRSAKAITEFLQGIANRIEQEVNRSQMGDMFGDESQSLSDILNSVTAKDASNEQTNPAEESGRSQPETVNQSRDTGGDNRREGRGNGREVDPAPADDAAQSVTPLEQITLTRTVDTPEESITVELTAKALIDDFDQRLDALHNLKACLLS